MKHATRTKYFSDIDVHERQQSRKPFRIEKDNQRRFVRLEISSPIALKKIKDSVGGFWPDGTTFSIDGTILNVSPGGVLIETEQPLGEHEIVAMRFTLQGDETLDYVLGMVKRSEKMDDFYLSGIEFIHRRHLEDKLSQGEIDMLSDKLADFQEMVQQVLTKYITKTRSSASQDGTQK